MFWVTPANIHPSLGSVSSSGFIPSWGVCSLDDHNGALGGPVEGRVGTTAVWVGRTLLRRSEADLCTSRFHIRVFTGAGGRLQVLEHSRESGCLPLPSWMHQTGPEHFSKRLVVILWNKDFNIWALVRSVCWNYNSQWPKRKLNRLRACFSPSRALVWSLAPPLYYRESPTEDRTRK